MVMSTLIGKLINVKRRGRLMLTATPIGAVSAVFFAWFVLRHWLSESGGQFFLIFGFAGICFVIGGALALSLREDRDETTSDSIRPSLLFREAIRTIAGDQRFQVLVLIAAMVGMSMTLFPHYQAMARERLNLGFSSLLPWLIAQNLGVAFFSIPAGGLADRFGNRFVLRITLLLICMAPIAAIVISRLPSIGEFAFSLVFVLLGLTPVTMRILSNYALELASPEDQPRYLSTLSLCMAGPAILTSTLLGLILDLTSFEFVFGLVLVCIFTGWTLTFKLAEPRRDQPKPSGL